MEKIIVTAEYQGEKEDKITALIETAQKAKQVADATKSRLQPLIDAAGAKKWEMILEQFHDFINRYEAFLKMTGDPQEWARSFGYLGCHVGWCGGEIIVEVPGGTRIDNVVRNGVLPWLCKDGGLVTNWNRLGTIEHFDSCLEDLIREYIRKQEGKKTTLEKIAKNMMN